MKEPVVNGQVIEALPNLTYKVALQNSDKEVICYCSGKMKLNKIKILIGDKVEVVVDKYGGNATNRIVRRK